MITVELRDVQSREKCRGEDEGDFSQGVVKRSWWDGWGFRSPGDG